MADKIEYADMEKSHKQTKRSIILAMIKRSKDLERIELLKRIKEALEKK